MHVAFFNRSYWPDQTATGQLLTDLAEDLVREHGCRVTVVSGPALAPLPGHAVVRRGVAMREERHGVTVLRATGTRFDTRRFAGRAANYLTYFGAACLTGLRLERPDVVVALTDPPIVGLAAALASRRFGVPFVMAFKDLFPEVTSLLPDFHSDAIDAALQRVNRYLVRRADMNIALGETMKQRLIQNKGAPPGRVTIIPDWADTSAIVPGEKDNAFARAHGLVDRFVVMHSGNLGLSQGLETIVEAAARLRDQRDIVFVFQGDGVSKAALEALVRAERLDNVRFLPFAPKASLGEAFAAADVFVVSLQRGLAGYIVPSKLYGILAAGRPYIAAVEEQCEVAALTRSRACGLVVEPGSAGPFVEAVLTFYRDRARAARCGRQAREAALTFDRRTQVARYLDVFRAVCRPETPAGAPSAERVS